MKHFLLILCLFVSAVIQAQVTGIVFDADTKEPLEYATIYCKAEGTGTVSNREGRFALFLKDPESEVAVSYMGYNTVKGTLSSNSEIPLRRATILLATHTVTPIEEAKKILKAVERQYRKNHHVNKAVCDVHLKQYDLADGKYVRAIDMMGELEIPTAKELKKTDRFRLSAVSAKIYVDTATAISNAPPEGLFAVFSNPYILVNILSLVPNKYDFHTTRIYQDNAVVYKIDFSYKKEKKNSGRFSGTLFIDEKTKAILEFRSHQDRSFVKGKRFKYNNEEFLFKLQDLGMRISYLKTDNNEYLMSYAIVYTRALLNEEKREVNIVLTNTNFNKSDFKNEHPIDISLDLGYQLYYMDLTEPTFNLNKILPTKKELEFFEKNK